VTTLNSGNLRRKRSGLRIAKEIIEKRAEEYKGVDGLLKLCNENNIAPNSLLNSYPNLMDIAKEKKLGWASAGTIRNWRRAGLIEHEEGKGFHLTEKGLKHIKKIGRRTYNK